MSRDEASSSQCSDAAARDSMGSQDDSNDVALESVTTWIPQQPAGSTFDLDGQGGWQASNGQDGWLQSRAKSHLSHRMALRHLLGQWEGRDRVLQFIQSIMLVIYSTSAMLRIPRAHRRRVHVASESIANARRLVIAARWLSDAVALLPTKDYGKAKAADASAIQEPNGSRKEDEKGAVQISSDGSPTDRPRMLKLLSVLDRHVGTLADVTAIAAEGCEIGAVVGGSAVIWRILGEKLAARQRRGLDRLALLLASVSVMLSLRRVEKERQETTADLRAANAQLLVATDFVHADDDAQTLLHGQKLSAEEALLRRKDGPNSLDVNSASMIAEADVTRKLRLAEASVRAQRRRLFLVRLERLALRVELPFLTLAALFPQRDHTPLEAWTGLLASIWHMSRISRLVHWKIVQI